MDAPQNGFVDHPTTVSVYDSSIFVATATFSCLPGFVLSGEIELACLETGLWSGPSPFCCKLLADFSIVGNLLFL